MWLYTYICIYIHTFTHTYIYVYIHILWLLRGNVSLSPSPPFSPLSHVRTEMAMAPSPTCLPMPCPPLSQQPRRSSAFFLSPQGRTTGASAHDDDVADIASATKLHQTPPIFKVVMMPSISKSSVTGLELFCVVPVASNFGPRTLCCPCD